MAISRIPIVDLSPFFTQGDEDAGKKEAAMEMMDEACSEYGFFQVLNHGVPLDLMSRALTLSKTFFELPMEEKRKCSPPPGTPYPTGYNRFLENNNEQRQIFFMFAPGFDFNVLPTDPPEFRDVLEELFSHLVKASLVVEKIISECLGLPVEFLSEYNNDRRRDKMIAQVYSTATADNQIGVSEHRDGHCLTFVLQDEVGGLEALKDGEWISLTPTEGALVVNLGDIIQVLSNDKYKSAVHRVMRTRGKARASISFFYSLADEKWVEPLPQFTTDVGQPPKYKRYLEGDFVKMRLNMMTSRLKNVSSAPNQEIGSIDYNAISPQKCVLNTQP
ncbi:flavonol synthase/flavanone 3-hydroxylase-like isoform X2 [Actinidia eriantha]|uniref:flavonol synthase/flavanone 3-hydroxylase-like isoform X1 n=1 Tax=Actinidia eriantha TaxID=165200 RepID=UPI002587A30F|nr:flavonol synthase/flavanone 3-hydroxylase-like isoform X1 [Actinidia eriantha]XP_057473104.1 flavonol synthase/flavanone 3-hydroxylase-like isoform X2 [Actinidia eriantha]